MKSVGILCVGRNDVRRWQVLKTLNRVRTYELVLSLHGSSISPHSVSLACSFLL